MAANIDNSKWHTEHALLDGNTFQFPTTSAERAEAEQRRADSARARYRAEWAKARSLAGGRAVSMDALEAHLRSLWSHLFEGLGDDPFMVWASSHPTLLSADEKAQLDRPPGV